MQLARRIHERDPWVATFYEWEDTTRHLDSWGLKLFAKEARALAVQRSDRARIQAGYKMPAQAPRPPADTPHGALVAARERLQSALRELTDRAGRADGPDGVDALARIYAKLEGWDRHDAGQLSSLTGGSALLREWALTEALASIADSLAALTSRNASEPARLGTP